MFWYLFGFTEKYLQIRNGDEVLNNLPKLAPKGGGKNVIWINAYPQYFNTWNFSKISVICYFDVNTPWNDKIQSSQHEMSGSIFF